MPAASYLIEVDWDLDGDFTDTYDDISADVKSIHFSRGKSDELGKAEVGQCSIVVNNATGKYTPGAGGVISSLLLPKRPIRVRATYAGSTYNLFYGYIEEIIPHPLLSEQDCIITAVDGLDFLSRNDMSSILVKDQLTGYLQKEILSDAGWPNGGIVTDGLVLNAPLWEYDLNGSSFLSKDNYQHSCAVTGAIWSTLGRTFDGNDYISAGNNAIFQLTTALTLEFWIKPVAASGYLCGMPYTTSWSNPYNAYQAYYLNNERFYFNANSNGTILGSAGDAPAGVWYHVIYVHRASGTRWQAYLNTVSYGTSAGGDPSYSGSPKFAIGTRNIDSLGEYGQGIIGEVRVYNKALTVAEILQNYNATRWRYETNIDAGQLTVPYWYRHDVKARFAQEEIDDNEQGFSYIDGAGNYCFEDRHHRSSATHQTSQGTFDNTMNDISYSINPKNVYNIIKATVTPWEIQAEAELWRLQETPSLAVGETKTYWGDASVGGTPVFVDAWVTPVLTTDYTASGSISILTSKFAQAIKLEITNTDTVPVIITLLKARGTWYDDQTQATRKAEDATSQQTYQKRTLSLDGKYMTNTDTAQSFCDYAKGKYKDPRAEIGMEIINQDAATLTQILSREISDRVTIVNDKLGILGIDVGNPAINRTQNISEGFTIIDLTNPTNYAGKITSIDVWSVNNLTGFRVGSFYLVSGTTYKCRDSATIGNVTGGSKQTFTGLSFEILTGDFIGCYYDTGAFGIVRDTTGGSGVMYYEGESIDAGDQAVYGALAGSKMSLYGYGAGNHDYFIDYMEHDISISGLLHTVTYRLADCINEDFWCLGYSKLGTQTKLGF